MTNNPKATALSIEYCTKYPDAPTNQIARMLAKDHPRLFNLNSARCAVRYRRGSMGRKKRHRATMANPLNLPISYERDFTPFICDAPKALLLSDIHIPYHSIPALTAALRHGKKFNPDTIILNGDTLDCHPLSRFEKDPESRDFAEEVRATKQFLDVLRQMFSKARIIWKDGNHDERYRAYLVAKAPELFGLADFRLNRVLGLDNLGIEYVTDKRLIQLGKLSVLHGHEFPGGATVPVNPARGLFLRAKSSAIQAHNHQTSEHIEPTVRGSQIGAWSTGCLCELHPRYMPYNKWGHGFATVEVHTAGDFSVRNLRIIDGAIV